MNNKTKVKKLVFSAFFLALGVVLPFVTGQIKEIGDSLLPMHLVVMMAGLVLGGKYGLLVGLFLPPLRSVTVGMPPIFPNAVWMALEFATYGFVLGFLYHKFFKKQIWWLYVSLFVSMISGRIVWGLAKTILLGVAGKAFTLSAFWIGGFMDAIPGIALQLVLIPFIVKLIEKYTK